MSSRVRLIASIPFWILTVASLALTGVGAWTVWNQLGRIEGVFRNPPTDQAGQTEAQMAVYSGPAAATVGAVMLGVGLIGLFLALALVVIKQLLAAKNVEQFPESESDVVDAPEAPSTAAGLQDADRQDIEMPIAAPAPGEPAPSDPTPSSATENSAR